MVGHGSIGVGDKAGLGRAWRQGGVVGGREEPLGVQSPVGKAASPASHSFKSAKTKVGVQYFIFSCKKEKKIYGVPGSRNIGYKYKYIL